MTKMADKIKIKGEFITFANLLKITGLVHTGGETKLFTEAGRAFCNESEIKEKRKKIHLGDIVVIDGSIRLEIVAEEEMKVDNLNLVNFRNYKLINLKIESMVNILYGRNAQGKTNLLESIYYAAFGMSQRTNNEDELIKIGQGELGVEVTFFSNSGEHRLRVTRNKDMAKKKKEVILDGNKISNREQYGSLNVVMFSPEDLQLIKGEPALRRRFLDMEIAQTNRLYYRSLVKYNRVLQQRNKLLKEAKEKKIDEKLFFIWDDELSTLAAELISHRMINLQKIMESATVFYGDIARQNEVLQGKYLLKTNGENIFCYEEKTRAEWKEWYMQALKERKEADLWRGSTGIGPHRDDLVFCVNDRDLRSFGSQGQQRTCALALKLAELGNIKTETGEYPILLLDDVMSELDNQRREAILNFINAKVQTFITVNDKKLIPELDGNRFFLITEGDICEEY